MIVWNQLSDRNWRTIWPQGRWYATPAVTVLLVACFGAGATVAVTPNPSGASIVKRTCARCHRIEGKPAPRRTKQAPDLIWAGNKYQREWLLAWLQNPEFKHYPVGYDFRTERKRRHLGLPIDQAKAVTEFLATRKDPRITEGVMKPGTPEQLERGQKLYREHGCQNCHLTPANTARGYTGGTSSERGLGLSLQPEPERFRAGQRCVHSTTTTAG